VHAPTNVLPAHAGLLAKHINDGAVEFVHDLQIESDNPVIRDRCKDKHPCGFGQCEALE
jgi:hypothetical protein